MSWYKRRGMECGLARKLVLYLCTRVCVGVLHFGMEPFCRRRWRLSSAQEVSCCVYKMRKQYCLCKQDNNKVCFTTGQIRASIFCWLLHSLFLVRHNRLPAFILYFRVSYTHCNQMAKLLFHYLAIYNNDSLLNCIKNCQNKSKIFQNR